jgi:Asp-tRNA(Asn)/Glu-tRNA(Gln) amidotransferase A subunit family amidase
MIKLPQARATDYRAFDDAIARIGSRSGLHKFYEEVIERYEKLNDQYLFSESFDREYVFAQLDEGWALRNRELFGIPFGVKDVFNTKVLPTAMGSEIWKGFKAGNNARVVDEIADHGGIIFSKTTAAEFAVHYIQAGKTINPHNADHITGTSSAGSAVAVACGALPICLGTQTAGSIVRPASFCGVFGFKPSFGAFDRTGTLKTTDTLDTIGLLGSDIYGIRKTFLAAFQKEPQYPGAQNYFKELKKFQDKDRLKYIIPPKIGLITDQFNGYSNYDSYVKKDFEIAVERLASAGIEVSPVNGVEFINDVHSLHDTIYCKALSYYFQDEFKRGSGLSKVMSDMISLASHITVDQYIDALHRQPEYRARFDAVFGAYDFLITPATASVAPMIGGDKENGHQRQVEKDDTCLIWTFFGYPVLSIPAFWSAEHDLPFGLQLIAPKYCDLALLEFGESVMRCLSDENLPGRE